MQQHHLGIAYVHLLKKMNRITCIIFTLICFTAFALSFDCSERPDGVYEHGCKVSLVCINGTDKEVVCLDNTVFNDATFSCDEPQHVAPPCGHLEDCTDKADGHYADIAQGCHSYYTCNGGAFLGHNFCPAGLVFNEISGVCDWASNVYQPCGSKPVPPTTTAEASTTFDSTSDLP